MGVLPCFYWSEGISLWGFSLVLSWGPMGGALGIPAVARVEKTSGEVTVSILQEIEEGKW